MARYGFKTYKFSVTDMVPLDVLYQICLPTGYKVHICLGCNKA